MENQVEVLYKDTKPLPVAKAFLWENNTALQSPDAFLLYILHIYSQPPADRIPSNSTYLWLAYLVSYSGCISIHRLSPVQAVTYLLTKDTLSSFCHGPQSTQR